MYKQNQAFTLIELLVVVLIIGILAGVALPQYRLAVEKARAASLLPLIRALHEAEVAYIQANSTNPSEFDQLDIDLPGGVLTTDTPNEKVYADNRKINLCGPEACGNGGSIIGYPNTNYPYYIEFYVRGQRVCWAKSNHNLANKICQAITHNTSFSTYESTNNNYYSFK